MNYRILQDLHITINTAPSFPEAISLTRAGGQMCISPSELWNGKFKEHLSGAEDIRPEAIEHGDEEGLLWPLIPVDISPSIIFNDGDIEKDQDVSCAVSICIVCQQSVVLAEGKFFSGLARPVIDYAIGFLNPFNWAKTVKGFADICQDKYARQKLFCTSCREPYLYCIYPCGKLLRCAGQKEIRCGCGQSYRVEY